MRNHCYIACILLLLSEAPAFAADIFYRPSYVPGIPCGWCEDPPSPTGINDLGQICGYMNRMNPGEGNLWDPMNGLQNVGLPPEAVNNLGHVVGLDRFWSAETGVIFLPQEAGNAYGINDMDEVVGIGDFGDGAEAFLWTPNAGIVGLGSIPGGFSGSLARDINNLSSVTGQANGPVTAEAFLWTPIDGMVAIGGLEGRAINNCGQTVGIRYHDIATPFRWEAFFWDPGTGMEGLGFLCPNGNCYSEAIDINDQGIVVGNSNTSVFIWDREHGIRDLNMLVTSCGAPIGSPVRVWFTHGINNVGQIICTPVEYMSDAILLTPALRGDIVRNEAVDLSDLARLLSNFGRTSGATYNTGDLDCDFDVDIDDLGRLLANFGETLP